VIARRLMAQDQAMRTVRNKVRLIVYYRNLSTKASFLSEIFNQYFQKKNKTKVAQVGDEIYLSLLSF
jgi:hypothetical protein